MNNQKGSGKYIKESMKKDGSYTFKYEQKSDTIENRLYILKNKLRIEYNKIDFKNDKYAGVKIEAVYNNIVGKEIEKAKKQKSNLKSEKKIQQEKEYLQALKERYPIQYEDYNIKIKNKLKQNFRKSKNFFKKLTL